MTSTFYKKLFFLLFVILATPLSYSASKTFFRPRQVSLDSTFQLALTNYDIYHHNNDCEDSWVNFYAKPFYQRSHDSCDLARYFLPNNNRCIEVRENGTGDVNSLFFNLISPIGTSFDSTVCLRPRRTTFGAVFTFYRELDCLCDNLWIDMNFAAMQAQHELRVGVTNNDGAGTLTGFATICDGFNNPAFTAGRLSCCKLKRSGVDDIQFRIGYNWLECENYHVSPYLVVVAPTGKRPCSKYLFEPLVGSKHAALGFGINADYGVYECEDHTLTLMGDFKYLYAFKARERRSFDLSANGDWSRYLLVAPTTTPVATIPGINLFTVGAQVTPRSMVDLWTGLHYEWCNWNFEIGYNFWWRQAEKVCIKCPLASDFGILDLAGICSGTALSASTATISQSIANSAASNTTFTTLSTSLLNQNSAAHPRSLTNKIYASAGYNADVWCYPVLLGLNGSYEFSHNRNALEQWAVWGTLGINF